MPKNNPKINEKKKKEVEILKELLKSNKVIGIADLTNLPSKQLQSIRSKLKKELTIRNFKRRLVKIAIEEIKEEKDLTPLVSYLDNSIPVMLFSSNDPFKLAKEIRKSKSKAAAKAGQIAPNDLVIPAGPTDFPPGPIIGELGQLGIIAAVEEGKVTIKQDKVVAKDGDEITLQSADLLAKMGVEPMEIGLNVRVFYDDGMIYKKDVFDVDEKEYIAKLVSAHQEVINLSVSTGYITKENVSILIAKANSEADALNKKVDLKEDKVVETKEEPQEVKAEEPKVEEKPAETKEDHIQEE